METKRRLPHIDIIRGYCIASMIAGHLGAGSIPIHFFPAFDGASGFVLLSGLVLGIVQSNRLDNDELGTIQKKTLYRIGFLYFAQIIISLAGILAYLIAKNDHTNLPMVWMYSPLEVVWQIFSLQLAPSVGSVLRLYVVLMILVLGAYWLLNRGMWKPLFAASLGLYILGGTFPDWTSFVELDHLTPGVNWGKWQILFFASLLVGWYWQKLNIPSTLREFRGPLIIICAVIIIFMEFLGYRHLDISYKLSLSPIWFFSAWAVIVLLYSILDFMVDWLPAWVFRPARIVGQYSLDSYIIQALVAIFSLSFLSFQSSSFVPTLIALATFGLCWMWGEIHLNRKQVRRLFS